MGSRRTTGIVLPEPPPPGEPADWRTLRRPMQDPSRRVWRREDGFGISGRSRRPGGTLSGNARPRGDKKRTH
jgi:hypothetical protein